MTRVPLSVLTTSLPGIGRQLTSSEAEHLHKYINLLIKWQGSHRLVGSTKPRWLIDNIFLDSLGFLEVLPPAVQQLADIGSGAGVPGIPIAIVRPDLELTLIEARRRRVSFLSTAIRELGLSHVQVVGARVETLEQNYGGRFDAIVMRCAGDLNAMLPHVLPLLRRGGAVVASAGPSPKAPSGGEVLTVRTHARQLRGFVRYFKP